MTQENKPGMKDLWRQVLKHWFENVESSFKCAKREIVDLGEVSDFLKEISISGEACAFCIEFYKGSLKGCFGCPIMESTKHHCCENSPWKVVAVNLNNLVYYVYSDRAIHNVVVSSRVSAVYNSVQEMYNFLKKLNPYPELVEEIECQTIN